VDGGDGGDDGDGGDGDDGDGGVGGDKFSHILRFHKMTTTPSEYLT